MARPNQEIFTGVDRLNSGISTAAKQGYSFVPYALGVEFNVELSKEAATLRLELGDHIASPINAGTKRQITQMHERAYLPVDHPDVPMATLATDALAAQAHSLKNDYPELLNWRPNEAGYQMYRDRNHHISKHRDRRNDQLLAATITILGMARVGIHEPVDDPDNYTNTRKIDEFLVRPGTIMFLRAAGLGSGEQVIHDVSPPIGGPRLILNLRMRPVEGNRTKILPQPS